MTSVILLCLSTLDVVSTLFCLMSRVGKWLRLQEELTSSHQQRSIQDAGGCALTGGRGVGSFLPSVLGMRAKAGIYLEFNILRERVPTDQRAECSNVTIGAFS